MERFIKPTDKQLVEIALLFNDGRIDEAKLGDMVAMAEFIIDRLHEHGDVSRKSSKELSDDIMDSEVADEEFRNLDNWLGIGSKDDTKPEHINDITDPVNPEPQMSYE